MAAFDEVLDRKKPREHSERVFLDDAPVQQFGDAQRALTIAQQTGADAGQLDKLQQDLDAAKQACIDASVVIRFRAIGREPFDDLLREHPPTDAQKAAAGEGNAPRFNIDTFLPALLAASAVDPQISIEQATRLCREWNSSEVDQLFAAAWAVNNIRRAADLGKEHG